MKRREFIRLKLGRVDEEKRRSDQIPNERSVVHDGRRDLHQGVAACPDGGFSPSDRFTDGFLMDRVTESIFFAFPAGEVTEEILPLADVRQPDISSFGIRHP
jgi:hypothetical protein